MCPNVETVDLHPQRPGPGLSSRTDRTSAGPAASGGTAAAASEVGNSVGKCIFTHTLDFILIYIVCVSKRISEGNTVLFTSLQV